MPSDAATSTSARPAEHVADRSDLTHAAADDYGDAVAHRQRLGAIVRHENRRRAGREQQGADVPPQTQPGRRIERGERLVEQQQPRTGCERPRQRDPLRLPARQRARVAILKIRNTEQRCDGGQVSIFSWGENRDLTPV